MSVTEKGHYIMDPEALAIQKRFAAHGNDASYCAVELLNLYRSGMDPKTAALADRTLAYHHGILNGQYPVWR